MDPPAQAFGSDWVLPASSGLPEGPRGPRLALCAGKRCWTLLFGFGGSRKGVLKGPLPPQCSRVRQSSRMRSPSNLDSHALTPQAASTIRSYLPKWLNNAGELQSCRRHPALPGDKASSAPVVWRWSVRPWQDVVNAITRYPSTVVPEGKSLRAVLSSFALCGRAIASSALRPAKQI